MSFGLQIVVVAAATLALFCAPSPLLARLLRRPAPDRANVGAAVVRSMALHVAAMVVRLVLAIAFAVALVLSRADHAPALLFTLGASYFAATVVDGVRRFRMREAVA